MYEVELHIAYSAPVKTFQKMPLHIHTIWQMRLVGDIGLQNPIIKNAQLVYVQREAHTARL